MVGYLDDERTRRRRRRPATATTTPATSPDATRTATSRTSAGPTTCSRAPTTASARSRSRARWSSTRAWPRRPWCRAPILRLTVPKAFVALRPGTHAGRDAALDALPLRARPAGPLQARAPDRVRRAAEDDLRQDPPRRAAARRRSGGRDGRTRGDRIQGGGVSGAPPHGSVALTQSETRVGGRPGATAAHSRVRSVGTELGRIVPNGEQRTTR